jgi:hypothetical protein
MRRLLCATALSGTVLLLGSGCSSDEPGTTAAPPPAASAAAPATSGGATASAPAAKGGAGDAGDAALSGNSDAICQQAAKTSGDAAQNFAQDLKLLIDAESAKDADQVAKAKAKTSRDVENYSYALTDMAELAADPALKSALADMGKRVKALEGDVRKLDAAQLTKLRDTLDQACGKG